MLLILGSTCHVPKVECLIFPGIFKTFQVLIHVVILPDEFLGSVHGAHRLSKKFSKDCLCSEVHVS